MKSDRNLKARKSSDKVFDEKHLIVDDVSSNRNVLKKYLAYHGIAYDECSNGAEAIEMVKQTNYKVVWMDIKMPVMNGVVATEKLRKDVGYKGLIIGITGNVEKNIIMECRKVGMNDFIAKPINNGRLVFVLDKYRYGNSGNDSFSIIP